MATITVLEIKHSSERWILENPILFVNDILDRMHRGESTQEMSWGRFVFTSHADDEPAVSWYRFAEVFKNGSTTESEPNQGAIMTIVELNHNGWMQIQREALTFVSVIHERLKRNSGSTDWVVSGRIMFTGCVNEEPILTWRRFAEQHLVS
jgi:hypothetical protein